MSEDFKKTLKLMQTTPQVLIAHKEDILKAFILKNDDSAGVLWDKDGNASLVEVCWDDHPETQKHDSDNYSWNKQREDGYL